VNNTLFQYVYEKVKVKNPRGEVSLLRLKGFGGQAGVRFQVSGKTGRKNE
jgi:hypothetical protein